VNIKFVCKAQKDNMNGHHLILGECRDYLSGQNIADTHDERYRQFLAKHLVEKCGYRKSDLVARQELKVAAGDKCALIRIDLSVVLEDQTAMIVRYGPGSLVTRHRPSIAASRLLSPYQIPVVVVTNGEDAHILDGKTSQVMAQGLESIPTRKVLSTRIQNMVFQSIPDESIEREQRILYAYDVDDSCPCDDTVCRL
jgi:hypothetical protein